MFRVPSRSGSPGAATRPRPTYDSRRQLSAVARGRNGWTISAPAWASAATVRPSLEPAFRAPWGELETEVVSVTITTRLFPLEWWRPPLTHARAASAHASVEPGNPLTSLKPLLRSASEGQGGIFGQDHALGSIGEAVVIPVYAAAAFADPAAGVAQPAPGAAGRTGEAAEWRQLSPERTRKAAEWRERSRPLPPRTTPSHQQLRQQRRGLLTRLAVVVIGLVISLVAVESATRRRA